MIDIRMRNHHDIELLHTQRTHEGPYRARTVVGRGAAAQTGIEQQGMARRLYKHGAGLADIERIHTPATLRRTFGHP